MRIVLRSLLAGIAVLWFSGAAEAQLDLRPPGAGARPAPQRARPPAVRAPRQTPLPEPRPDEAGGSDPELSSLPAEPAPIPAVPPVIPPPEPPAAAVPTVAPPAPQATPATPAPPAAPAPAEGPANPIDEAFRDTARSSSRAAPIPPNHPAVLGAPARNGVAPSPPPLLAPGGVPSAPPLAPPRAETPAGAATAAAAGEPHFDWRDHENRIRTIEQRFGGQNYGIIAR